MFVRDISMYKRDWALDTLIYVNNLGRSDHANAFVRGLGHQERELLLSALVEVAVAIDPEKLAALAGELKANSQ